MNRLRDAGVYRPQMIPATYASAIAAAAAGLRKRYPYDGALAKFNGIHQERPFDESKVRRDRLGRFAPKYGPDAPDAVVPHGSPSGGAEDPWGPRHSFGVFQWGTRDEKIGAAADLTGGLLVARALHSYIRKAPNDLSINPIFDALVAKANREETKVKNVLESLAKKSPHLVEAVLLAAFGMAVPAIGRELFNVDRNNMRVDENANSPIIDILHDSNLLIAAGSLAGLVAAFGPVALSMHRANELRPFVKAFADYFDALGTMFVDYSISPYRPSDIFVKAARKCASSIEYMADAIRRHGGPVMNSAAAIRAAIYGIKNAKSLGVSPIQAALVGLKEGYRWSDWINDAEIGDITGRHSHYDILRRLSNNRATSIFSGAIRNASALGLAGALAGLGVGIAAHRFKPVMTEQEAKDIKDSANPVTLWDDLTSGRLEGRYPFPALKRDTKEELRKLLPPEEIERRRRYFVPEEDKGIWSGPAGNILATTLGSTIVGYGAGIYDRHGAKHGAKNFYATVPMGVITGLGYSAHESMRDNARLARLREKYGIRDEEIKSTRTLSPAELQQRKDAARARWEKERLSMSERKQEAAALGTAGGLAGGALFSAWRNSSPRNTLKNLGLGSAIGLGASLAYPSVVPSAYNERLRQEIVRDYGLRDEDLPSLSYAARKHEMATSLRKAIRRTVIPVLGV